MNLLVITGNLGADAEVRKANGKQVIGFNVAVTKKYKDSATGGQATETTWIKCSWFTESTGIIPFLTKGQQVMVQGEAKVSAYLKNDITPTGSLECFVGRLELLGGKSGSDSPQNHSQGDKEEPAGVNGTQESDDIPF